MPVAATRQRRKSYVQRLMTPLFAIVALGYFGFHALSGDLGLVGSAIIEREVQALESELTILTAEREDLLARVSLLRPETLDPDMLEERARLNLNLVHHDVLVVLRPGYRYAINQK